MADTTGNDPKAPDTRSGAVKPPVLDLKARESGTGASEKAAPSAAASKPSPADKPGASAKPAEPTQSQGFPIGATLAGGVIGLAAAYGLAWAGLWPATPVPAAVPDPRIASLSSAIPELETVTQTTQSELAALNQRIAALESAEPAAAPPAAAATDLAPLESEVGALSARIEELAGAATNTDDSEALKRDLSAVGTRLDEIAARLGAAEAGLRTLDTTVAQTTTTLASQPSDIGAVLQLPLILSGFESAFVTGRPYVTELAALRAAIPDATIPTSIANGAETGLPRPDVIATRFGEVLPDMLAGTPPNPDAQWQDGALDWFAAAIALRPTGEVPGDTPQAIVSRLESAIARRDFTAAETLFSSLPTAMQTAGGGVAGLIASQAEASRFLDTLRNSALSGEAMQ